MDSSKKPQYGRSWENVHFYQGKNPICNDNSNEKAERIVRFLRDQLQLKNLSFLFGSGTSAPALPLMAGLYEEVKKEIEKTPTSLQSNLFYKVSMKAQGNLEEILGLLYARLSYYLGIKKDEDKDKDKDEDEETKEYNTTKSLIEQIERHILTQLNQNISDKCSSKKISQQKTHFTSTLKVYEIFYRTLALRPKELSRLSVFTTNNDLFNETAMDNTNTMYINGFTPGLKRHFNPSLFYYTYSKRMDSTIDKYEPVDNMVYLYKLHGSVNWVEQESVGNKFYNIVEIDATQSGSSAQNERVMIYPTPTKQNKSLGSPYTDIIRAFHHKLLQPNSVLFVCGYSFSDEHLNRIIYQALAANSSLNVVVVNKLEESKEIKQVDDRRIYHLWEENQVSNTESNSSVQEENQVPNTESNFSVQEENQAPNTESNFSVQEENQDSSKGAISTENEEGKTPIHYFSEFIKLLSVIITQQDDSRELLSKFSNDILQSLSRNK